MVDDPAAVFYQARQEMMESDRRLQAYVDLKLLDANNQPNEERARLFAQVRELSNIAASRIRPSPGDDLQVVVFHSL